MSACDATRWICAANTVGYAFPHIECKIIDPETGEELPDGVRRRVLLARLQHHEGLLQDARGHRCRPSTRTAGCTPATWPAATRTAATAITGRLKDMIIRGGENIYPKEIEEFIYTHPAVKDVQVIGVPDKKYGEEAMACIILKEPAQTVTRGRDAASTSMASLARHKVPAATSSFVECLPHERRRQDPQVQDEGGRRRGAGPSEPGEEVAASIHRHSAGAVQRAPARVFKPSLRRGASQ